MTGLNRRSLAKHLRDRRVIAGSRSIDKGGAGRPLVSAMLAVVAVACTADPPAPAPLAFAGLPVAGTRAFAAGHGFARCIDIDAVHVRCRRSGVMVLGQGPYEAAVDLTGDSGFRELTLWSDEGNSAVYRVVIALARRGWTYCWTGTERAGDQAIFSRPGEPVRVSLDISYWSKRRIRIIPAWNRKGLGGPCHRDGSLARFGSEVARAAVQPL